MFVYSVLTLFSIVFVVVENKSENIQESCELLPQNGYICVKEERCLEKGRFLNDPNLKRCGSNGNRTSICCKKEAVVNQTNLISFKKCLEYQAVDTYDRTIPYRSLVLGGIKALAKEFPHMAALGFGTINNTFWLCGGSLISPNFILTVAHCLYTKNSGTVQFVRLGTLDLAAKPNSLQDFTIIEVFQHPEYVYPIQYNDIGLLKLDRDATFTDFVKPACLHGSFYLPSYVPVATGWGETEFRGEVSKNLQRVDLSYFTFEECKEKYSTIDKKKLPNGIRDELQICAGGRNEQKDTCQGDSGGPLQIKFNPYNKKSLHFIVGITSFGKACGIPNTPAIYTRVSHFIPWIEDIVWNKNS